MNARMEQAATKVFDDMTEADIASIIEQFIGESSHDPLLITGAEIKKRLGCPSGVGVTIIGYIGAGTVEVSYISPKPDETFTNQIFPLK